LREHLSRLEKATEEIIAAENGMTPLDKVGVPSILAQGTTVV